MPDIMSAADGAKGSGSVQKKPKKAICFLCRRKFPDQAALLKHEEKSELHEQNLAKRMRDNVAKRSEARSRLFHQRNQYKELQNASALRSDDAALAGLEKSMKESAKLYGDAQLILEDRPKGFTRTKEISWQGWKLHCGVETWQCFKDSQEDRFVINMQYERMGLCGFLVLDGHSGSACADYTAEHLWDNITKHLDREKTPVTEDSLKEAITNAFAETDKKFLGIAEKQDLLDGTTACLVIFWTDETDMNMDGSSEKRKKLICANVGDSRAVIAKTSGRGVAISDDHKPNRNDEVLRIQKAGGNVVEISGVPRVFTNHTIEVRGMQMQWGLAVSRALGDRPLKNPPFVISEPEFKVHQLSAVDVGVVLGCDGVWDVTSDSEAAKMLCNAPTNIDVGTAARQIVRSSFERLSDDNTTVIAIKFEQGNDSSGDEKQPPAKRQKASD